jgi:hypothetical protein
MLQGLSSHPSGQLRSCSCLRAQVGGRLQDLQQLLRLLHQVRVHCCLHCHGSILGTARAPKPRQQQRLACIQLSMLELLLLLRVLRRHQLLLYHVQVLLALQLQLAGGC